MVEIQNTSKVISVTQDYIILGKSTKDTEIRINVHGENYEESKQKVENMIRLAALAEGYVAGNIVLPHFVPKNPVNIRFEGEE
mgnify:CR=1 FL=1